MNELLKSDYGRICEMAHCAHSVEEASVVLFYVYQMCRQLGLDNDGLAVRFGEVSLPGTSVLHEAIWTGVAEALWDSPAQIAAFRPVEARSYRGRLLRVDLCDVEHSVCHNAIISFSLDEIVKNIEIRRQAYSDLGRGMLRDSY